MISKHLTDFEECSPIQTITSNIIVILCIAFFAVQPLNIYHADAIWLLLSLISLVYVTTLKIKKHDFNLPKESRHVLWAFAAMAMVSILSYLLSPLDTLKPFQLEADLRFLLIIPIVVILVHIKAKKELLITCLIAYSLTSFASAAYETDYLTNLSIRADGHENAVPFGMFTATVAILLILLSKDIRKTDNPIVSTLILLCSLLALATTVLSGTRAGILLVAVGLTAIIFLSFPIKKAFLTLFALVISVSILYSAIPNKGIKQRINDSITYSSKYFSSNNPYKGGSIGGRFEQWREAWCIFTKHPILGTGPRSFRNAHQKYKGVNHCNANQERMYKNRGGSYQAHSLYFNTLATTGLFGLIVLMYLFMCICRIAITILTSNRTNIAAQITLLVLIAHTVNGLTLDLWFRNHVMDKNLIILALPIALITLGLMGTDRLTTTIKSIT